MELQVQIDSEKAFAIKEEEKGLLIDGVLMAFDLKKLSDTQFIGWSGLKSYKITILESKKDDLLINIDGHELSLTCKDEIALMLDKLGMDVSSTTVVNEIVAPMPGLILDIQVNEGDDLNEGDGVIVLEAMKMENLIKSPVKALVKKVHVTKGQNVEKNQVLISF